MCSWIALYISLCNVLTHVARGQHILMYHANGQCKYSMVSMLCFKVTNKYVLLT